MTCVVFLLLASPSHAHKPSDSYLNINLEKLTGQWDIALRDLDYAIGLDDNNDSLITWREVKKHHLEISNYALSHLKIKGHNKEYKIEPIEQLIENHSDGTYSVLKFKINTINEELLTESMSLRGAKRRSNPIQKKFDIYYTLFFDLDPQHRGLLNLKYKDKTITRIFSDDKQIQNLDLNALNPFYQLLEFIKEGIWHIWIGFDHILFLIALLLPAVLPRGQTPPTLERSDPLVDPSAFWNIFKIVTAFTIAHSITLSLASFGVVQLPSKFVESTIAASVFIAALNNLRGQAPPPQKVPDPSTAPSVLIAFLFGLVHGFGFASVLMDLGLNQSNLFIPLFSFNIGVEIGQLVIVAAFLPIAFAIRNHWVYQRLLLVGGSTAISIISLVWFVERVF